MERRHLRWFPIKPGRDIATSPRDVLRPTRQSLSVRRRVHPARCMSRSAAWAKTHGASKTSLTFEVTCVSWVREHCPRSRTRNSASMGAPQSARRFASVRHCRAICLCGLLRTTALAWRRTSSLERRGGWIIRRPGPPPPPIGKSVQRGARNAERPTSGLRMVNAPRPFGERKPVNQSPVLRLRGEGRSRRRP